ncbi:MAG TPA: hypothetical protein VMF52_14370 [Steroidobacteraceae bacterium]|nr:hypothetical protein [Steroidobacteraceae bacterium]
MKTLTLGSICLVLSGLAAAHSPSPVSVEIVSPDGRGFREIPLESRDGAWRSYLQAERGARYEVRVRNSSGARLGLVIAVDGRNIINGKRSELGRDEPMYVVAAGDTQDFAGWRASLDEINEFYFTDWKDSYSEAFGDRSARGVIAVAVYREVPQPPPRVMQPYEERAAADKSRAAGAASSPAPAARDESVGTGYGERRTDRAYEVEFVAENAAESRHFIKYEWRETLCRKRVIDCGEPNRLWDDDRNETLGFAPPPPGGGRD